MGLETVLYKDIHKSGNVHSDHHALYFATCKVCGTIVEQRLSDIKRTNNCHHNYYNGKNIKNSYLHNIFKGMLKRCYNPDDKSYKWYGKKGIEICDEWLKDRTMFEQWALDNGYKKGLSIDRIDENKNYCPENCRWISVSENAAYKSTTKTITVNGITKSGRAWADFLGMGTNYINNYRRKYGLEKTKQLIAAKLSELEENKVIKVDFGSADFVA